MDYERNDTEWEEMNQEGCSAVGCQDVSVCIPVTIKPYGEAGNATTKCLGKAVVSAGCKACPGPNEGACHFTISQMLRVEVPVVFGARAEIGEASVSCGCTDCGCEPEYEASCLQD